MANAIRNFRDLDVWRCGMDLVVLTYEMSDSLPDSERYGLRAQMRRAAVSIPSNVAEGHAFRTNPKAYGRHVRIALGSLAELETHVEIGIRLKFLAAPKVMSIQGAAVRTGQLLHGLLRRLRSTRGVTPGYTECRVRQTSRKCSSGRHSRSRVLKSRSSRATGRR